MMTTPKQILTDKIRKWVGDEKQWRYIATKQHVIRHLRLTASELASSILKDLVDDFELHLTERWSEEEWEQGDVSEEGRQKFKEFRGLMREFLAEVKNQKNDTQDLD